MLLDMSSIDYKRRKSMSDCKIYPADTVDIYGNVWSTVGENIRNGMFGENVKVGYVNIDNGKITSNDFNISTVSPGYFVIEDATAILVFTETITGGVLNITFENSAYFCKIQNNPNFSNTVATLKIIYKDII